MAKTNGQTLYEHKNPQFRRMIPADCRFPTRDDVELVKNDGHVPWELLTDRCRSGWEVTAIGHHLFSRGD